MNILILVISFLSTLINLGLRLWLLRGWQKGAKRSGNSSQEPPFSIIIAARNEATNLSKYLPAILKQNYSSYEVIIALNHCEDDSVEVVKNFCKVYSHLSYIEIPQSPEGWAPKKWALDQGIRKAQYEHLVFTDADCEVGNQWLRELAAVWADETELVLGIGRYFRYPSLLNRFIRFETSFAAFQYIGMAGQALPYMGVGRNMAYLKSLFLQVGGFEAFRERLSGDDDLFVNAYAKGEKTQVMLAAASHSFSEPERRFGSWVRQKVRHVSASAKYSLRSKIFLASFHLSQIALYTALGGLFILGGNLKIAFLLYVLYLSIAWYIFGKINKIIGEPSLVAWYPLLDLLFVVYNLSMVPLGLIVKPRWKKKTNQKSRKTP